MLGDPLPPFCWALDFLLAWTGQRTAAWATCRMLKAGVEEESSFPSEGGCESRLCQEGMLCMLGSAMGFGFEVSPWIFLFTFSIPFQAWLGRWVCRHRGVGRSEVRDWGGRGINIIIY